MKGITVHLLLVFLLTISFPALSFTGNEYLVDEGDVLKISVYDHPDLATTVRVSGDGIIMFPYIGQVTVAGLTIPKISSRIAESLADGYIVNPKVNVFVEQFRAQHIFVSGEVGKPGAVQFEMDMNLIKVITLAGGFKGSAAKDKVTISRMENDQKVVLENPGSDEIIRPGDIIEVPMGVMQDIFVTGQVKSPGVNRFEEGITVIKAITMAGGFTDIAAKGKISISRKSEGKELILKNVSMNDLLHAGDVIIVPESFF